MAASTTSQVYIDVIEDVMVKVRDEFVNNGGPGEEVLKELQAVISLLCLCYSHSSMISLLIIRMKKLMRLFDAFTSNLKRVLI